MDEWIIQCAGQGLNPTNPAAVRWGYLELALKSQLALLAGAPTTTRRLTLVRILTELGRRAEAISRLTQCLAEIEDGSARVSTPFLGPSRTWEGIPGDRLAEWLFAALVETRCRLAAHSTFFLSDQDVAHLLELDSLGLDTDFSRNVRRVRSERGVA